MVYVSCVVLAKVVLNNPFILTVLAGSYTEEYRVEKMMMNHDARLTSRLSFPCSWVSNLKIEFFIFFFIFYLFFFF